MTDMKSYMAKIAGGAYQLSNPAAVTIRTAIARLRAKKDTLN